MDTNDTLDIPFDLPEVIGALRKTLLEELRTLTKRFDKLEATTLDTLEPGYLPEDRVLTRDEYDRVARDFISKCDSAFNYLDVARASYREGVRRPERLQRKMIKMVQDRLETPGLQEAEKQRCVWHKEMLLIDLLACGKHRQGHLAEKSARLQSGLLGLLVDPPEEIQQWYHDKYLAQYADHIESKRSDIFKPVVEVSEKRFDRPTALSLPPELIHLVYSFCDVETCVTLRQVSSTWFHGFENVDLEQKLASRNPWIRPEDGDLKTWTDCVLVFVARLQSSKWTATDKPSSVRFSGKSQTKKVVIARELKYEEKLPVEFTGLVGDWTCKTGVCNHLHAHYRMYDGDRIQRNDEYMLNPWNMEHKISHEAYQFVTASSNEERTVVRYKGVEFGLPKRYADLIVLHDPADRFQRHVTLLPSFIIVHLTNDTLIALPRDAKPDFNNFCSMDTKDTRHVFPKELNGILMLEIHGPRNKFCFVDFCTKEEGKARIKTIPADSSCSPVAAHNGLIWWQLYPSRGICALVPSFLDLEQPDKFFYRDDRAIFRSSPQSKAQGVKSRGWSKYLISVSGGDRLELVDLDTRHVTLITTPVPSEWPAGEGSNVQLFVGFQNGKFCARFMSPTTMVKTCKGVLDAHGFEHNDYDDYLREGMRETTRAARAARTLYD